MNKFLKILFLTFLITLLFSSVCYASIVADGTVFFEAEDTRYIYPPMVVKQSEGASGGEGVTTSGASQNTDYSMENISLSYEFETKRDDAFYVWMRIMGEGDAGSNVTYYASVDNGVYKYVRTAEEAKNENINTYQWVFVDKFWLLKGEHKLNFIYRAANIYVDAFYITDDYKFTPDGKKPGGIQNPYKIYERDEKGNIIGDLYYNLPAYTPPAEHPRLFFRAKDLPRIRKNLTHPQNIKEWEILQKNAEYNGDGVCEPLVSGKTDNPVSTISSAIEANAFLYQITGEKHYGEKAIRLAKSYGESYMCDHSATSPSNRNALSVSQSIAFCYDWCYDLLSEEDKDYLIYLMLFQFHWSETGYPAIKYLDHEYTGHIHEFQLLSAHTSVAIAIYDEAPDVWNVAAGRLLQTIIPGVSIFNQNGTYSEGSNYGLYRHSYEIINNYMFYAMGYENVYYEEGLRALSEFYLRQPDGEKLTHADDGAYARTGYLASSGSAGLFYLGNMLKNPYFKTEYLRTRPNENKSKGDMSPAIFLAVNDPSVAADRSFRDFPLTMFSGLNSGHMFARTSWDEGYNANTVLCMLNLKPFYYHGHEHIDIGHFSLYYKGGLALDSGCYAGQKFTDSYGTEITSVGSGNVHQTWYAKRTIAHNTMLIRDPNETLFGAWATKKLKQNGYKPTVDGGQRIDYVYNYNLPDSLLNEEYRYTDILGYNWGPDFKQPRYTYFKGDMAAAYDYKAEKAQRTFMFFNFKNDKYPAALIVFDAVRASSPTFQKTYLLHTEEEPKVEGNVSTVVRDTVDYNGRMINETLMPTNGFKIDKIGGKGYEFYIDGVNYEMQKQSNEAEVGNWRLEISPTTAEKESYLLNVMQLSDNDDSITPLKSKLIEETNEYVGVEIFDHVAYMRKDGKVKNTDFVINPGKSENERFFVITGLGEGLWSVYNEKGEQIASEYSYKIIDSISFEGKGGKFTLKYKYAGALKAPDMSVYANQDNTKKGLDVQLDGIYQTFENEWYEYEGTVFAPIKETLYYLDITNVSEDFYEVKVNDPIKPYGFKYGENYVTRFNGVLYAPVSILSNAVGFTYNYDENATIMRVNYGMRKRDLDKIFKHNDPNIADVAFGYTEGETTKSILNSLDNDTNTYTVIQEEGTYYYVLTEHTDISKIGIRWEQGHKRRMKFELYVSEDGQKWTEIFRGESDGVTQGYEFTDVPDHNKYKYIRIECHGNNANSYNSINEFIVYK